MEPLHVVLDKYRRGVISRREYLKRAVALGVSTPLLLSALEETGKAQDSQTLSPTFPPQDEIDGNPIVFKGWVFETDVVEDNVRIFEDMYNENVAYETITGDYGLIIDTMQLNKDPLDMFYGHESEVARYMGMGGLLPYNDWWDFDRAVSEMYPAFVDAWTWKDGKLYGLPYYTAIRGTIMINLALSEKAGISELQLTTWDDFYDLCTELKRDGVAEHPLLHHWNGTSWATAWQFLWECQNRGIALFDFEDDYRPLFDGDHESARVLERWHQLFADGVTPESSFNMQEGDYIDAFAKGEYVFSPQQTYDAKRFNDPALSQIAGMVDWASPPPGKPWGKYEMGGYIMPFRDRSDEEVARVLRHNSFYGYRDINDELFVAKRWAVEKALNSGYRSILEDPDVLEAYKQWMPGGDRQFKDMQVYFDQVEWDPIYMSPWFSEFLLLAKAELEPAILGSQSPKDSLNNLRKGTDELWERFRGRI